MAETCDKKVCCTIQPNYLPGTSLQCMHHVTFWLHLEENGNNYSNDINKVYFFVRSILLHKFHRNKNLLT